MKLNKSSLGVIKIQAQSLTPERFINLLWKSEIYIKKIKRENITTLIMEIRFKDYSKILEAAKKTDTKIKIMSRQGLALYLFKLRRQWALIGGVLVFAAVMFYLSTFIWSVQIVADGYISPYEIRQKLNEYGIKPGVAKSKLDVRTIENKMINENQNIMWIRARIEGSALKVTVEERHEPPQIVQDNSPCDVIAKLDGEVMQIFTTAGTAVVKPGDVVKKGQLLIKGEQGNEANIYPVHADGEVIAKTFYEYERQVQIKGVKKVRTGRVIKNQYIIVLGKKIYLKKSLNRFESYDKIEDNKSFLKTEIYYETKETSFSLDKQTETEKVVNDLKKMTMESLDKSVKLIDKNIEAQLTGDNLKIRVVFIIQQDISIKQKLEQ